MPKTIYWKNWKKKKKNSQGAAYTAVHHQGSIEAFWPPFLELSCRPSLTQSMLHIGNCSFVNSCVTSTKYASKSYQIKNK